MPLVFITQSINPMNDQTKTSIIFDLMRTLYDPEHDRLIAGAHIVLEELHRRGHVLYLVSKKEGQRQGLVTEYGIGKYFREVHLVTDKLDAMRTIRDTHRHEKIWVVGDRVRGEVMAGNKIGAVTVWFRNGKFAGEVPQVSEEKPDFTITSLEDVLELIG